MSDHSSLAELVKDPVKFCQLCWPDLKLYDKQCEILYSIRDNYETFVHAGNELGKDFTAGIVALWFFASRSPARVVTSSSGNTQLKSVLWAEINQRIATSKIELGFDQTTMCLKKVIGPNGETDPMSYCIGHVTNSVENFQGHHLPHDIPRTLYIADEASGIADEFFDAADSWAHRKLVIGNPLNTTTFFYRYCKKGDVEDVEGTDGLYRKVIHIGSEHSPNVILGDKLKEMGIKPPYPTIVPGVVSWKAFQRRLSQWDKIKRHTRLHGHFYEGEEVLLYPPGWLDESNRKFETLFGSYEESVEIARKALAIGVDTGAGRDLTVWTMIDRKGIIEQIAEQTPDTANITKKTQSLIGKYGVDPDKVLFDAGGGGKQIADELRSRGLAVRSVYFGGRPSRPLDHKAISTEEKIDTEEDKMVYKNRRAEMYGVLREQLDLSVREDELFAIPEELWELRQELAPLPLWYDQEGRMYLPPKEKPQTSKDPDFISLRKILGRSPDRADSLVLAAFSLFGVPEVRTVGAF